MVVTYSSIGERDPGEFIIEDEAFCRFVGISLSSSSFILIGQIHHHMLTVLGSPVRVISETKPASFQKLASQIPGFENSLCHSPALWTVERPGTLWSHLEVGVSLEGGQQASFLVLVVVHSCSSEGRPRAHQRVERRHRENSYLP